jgi:hypothetical protein
MADLAHPRLAAAIVAAIIAACRAAAARSPGVRRLYAGVTLSSFPRQARCLTRIRGARGHGSGIARAIALAVSEEGGRVIAAGRRPDDLAGAYSGRDIDIEQVDVTDESSIAALAGRIGVVDHVVSTASVRARGGYRDLTASLVNASFDTKVTGPCCWPSTSRETSRPTDRSFSCQVPPR